MAGFRPCPPEDIGGIERYLEAREEHSEYEFLDWLESLREGPIALEDLRDEVDGWTSLGWQKLAGASNRAWPTSSFISSVCSARIGTLVP
ncbi:hypothetical protein [Cupriavidus pinatubonensis]|uniref:hypothetical protein n=1 Tax=Cupriavidus pinatubonensis TaxID=248026 RepID=UPI0037BF68F4